MLRSGNHAADVPAMLENDERGDKGATRSHRNRRSVMRRVKNEHKKRQSGSGRN